MTRQHGTGTGGAHGDLATPFHYYVPRRVADDGLPSPDDDDGGGECGGRDARNAAANEEKKESDERRVVEVRR